MFFLPSNWRWNFWKIKCLLFWGVCLLTNTDKYFFMELLLFVGQEKSSKERCLVGTLMFLGSNYTPSPCSVSPDAWPQRLSLWKIMKMEPKVKPTGTSLLTSEGPQTTVPEVASEMSALFFMWDDEALQATGMLLKIPDQIFFSILPAREDQRNARTEFRSWRNSVSEEHCPLPYCWKIEFTVGRTENN